MQHFHLERPALRKLLADIQAGAVDCVLVYKIDRLSRSLLDFARLMEIFERHDVFSANSYSRSETCNTAVQREWEVFKPGTYGPDGQQ